MNLNILPSLSHHENLITLTGVYEIVFERLFIDSLKDVEYSFFFVHFLKAVSIILPVEA